MSFTLLLALGLGAVPQPGDAVGQITFKDIHFLNRTLNDVKDAKAYALVFLDTGCPLVARYGPTLKQLDSDFRNQGVRLVGLFPNGGDTVPAIAAFGVKYELFFPLGQDIDAVAANAVGATMTPEVVVLDADKKVRYRGRIDDQ